MGIITVRQAVHHFVYDVLHTPAAASMITEWRVEEAALISIISNHLNSLGIYYIEPHMRETLETDVLFQLKHSKLISAKVQKAANEEKMRKTKNSANTI